jgi:hypothetical protein
MGALYRVATVLGPRSLLRLLLPALAALAACGGGRRPAIEDVRPRELLVEVLPPGADVVLDGRPLGRGSRAVDAPAPGLHVLRVEADGYEPAERPLPEGSLAGARVAEALRPEGLATAGALDYDDPAGLAQAAAHLARPGGRPDDAVAYAERALALEPGAALAHRALGDAREALGDRVRAAASWAEYLRLAPDAADAEAVARRVEGARADVTSTGR